MTGIPLRCKPFALAALTWLLANAAHATHGAALLLRSDDGWVHTCQASVWSRDYELIKKSDYLRVDSHGAEFIFGPVGAFAPDASGDTPRFGALGLRCWEPTPNAPGMKPPAGTPSYSLTLFHDSNSWDVPKASGAVHMLPRDDRMLQLAIAGTDDPDHRFRITRGELGLWYAPSLDGAVYGAAMHRHFHPT